MINYSIIIPHKNIPDLLRRCLDSIPLREDVQVIVVDDNSDPEIVDFKQFPRWEGKNYDLYLTKEGKGAGYARNVGLQHAVGKWVLFADADDFFSEEFDDLMDEEVGAVEDVVFYDYKNVLSDDVSKGVERRIWYKEFFSDYLKGKIGSEDNLRTEVVVPWCKFIKRDVVEEHKIRFDEVKWSNDVYFSAMVAVKARKVRVNSRIGYVLTERIGSLANDFMGSWEEMRVRLLEAIKSDALFRANGYCKVGHVVLMLNSGYAKHGFWWLVWFGMININNRTVFCTTMSFLHTIGKRKIKKHLRLGK